MQRISFPSLKSFAIAGVLAVAAHAANAASYTFSFANAVGTSFVEPGLTLNVNDALFDSTGAKTITDPSIGSVTNSSFGLGVDYFAGGNDRMNTPASQSVAASGPGVYQRELLTFVFSHAVKLVSVGLADITSGSRVLFFNNNVALDAATQTGALALHDVANTAGSFTNQTGTKFGVGARFVTGIDSGFYVASITVEDLPSAVPLPAGGLLLGSLVVVPFLRRKRRAA